MLKVDIRKAYDTPNWNFLDTVLIGLGFPITFIGWTMQCVTTASYSILVNGSPHGYFKGKRGLRQGDPLSPFLFVLAMEYLSRSLKQLHWDPEFSFHPKWREGLITHLCFADDLVIFSKADSASLRKIMERLKAFGDSSGLMANFHKSEFFVAGVQDYTDLQSITGFSLGTMPFHYLGIPIAGYRLQVCHYSPCISRLLQKINLWKTSSLSYAGRLELIKSVFQGIYCFWLNALPVPYFVLDQINRICMHFLWGKSDQGNRRALFAWSHICKPKSEGGLGIFEIRSWNSALLAKHLWNIHRKKDTLWV